MPHISDTWYIRCNYPSLRGYHPLDTAFGVWRSLMKCVDYSKFTLHPHPHPILNVTHGNNVEG